MTEDTGSSDTSASLQAVNRGLNILCHVDVRSSGIIKESLLWSRLKNCCVLLKRLRADKHLTASSSSVSSRLVRWSTASSMSESSSRPERGELFRDLLSPSATYFLSGDVRLHCVPLTVLLPQQCEHRRGRDLQTGVALHQGGEDHGAQRRAEGGEHVLLCWGEQGSRCETPGETSRSQRSKWNLPL